MMAVKILAGISLAIGAWIIGVNWLSIYWSYRHKHFVSSVPLIGAMFFGLGLLGFRVTQRFVWVAVLLDYGTMMLVIGFPYSLWRHRHDHGKDMEK